MENRKARKLRRAVICTLGALYLLVVIGATIYSQTGYLDSLPLVKIGSPDQGRVPASAAAMGQDGPILYSVSQEDGPRGKRYLLRSVPSYSFQELEDGTLFFFMMDSLEDPLVLSASVPMEVLYDGMEVRLG